MGVKEVVSRLRKLDGELETAQSKLRTKSYRSESEIHNEIQILLARIASLEQQLNPAPVYTAPGGTSA